MDREEWLKRRRKRDRLKMAVETPEQREATLVLHCQTLYTQAVIN